MNEGIAALARRWVKRVWRYMTVERVSGQGAWNQASIQASWHFMVTRVKSNQPAHLFFLRWATPSVSRTAPARRR